MNISTDFTQVSPDTGKPESGYEWWYFDGMSADGKYGFSVIFYQNNPFSTRKIKELENGSINHKSYPAVSISLYENNKTIYYSFLEFEESDYEWREGELMLTIGRDSFSYSISGDTVNIEIMLNQQLASGHKIRGTISGSGCLTASNLIQSMDEDRHLWNLILPSMNLEADIDLYGRRGEERVHFHGKGYHDHNTGFEPMKESFKDWYWGRYHFEDFTLVYYLMQKHDASQFEGWLIDKKNQSVLEHLTEINLDYYTRNWFGLNSARKIEIIEDQVTVNIQYSNKIDDGPFYQRFIGNSIINYNGQVHAAQGISEYLRPKRIYKKSFWPLVHMRLRYVGEKPHWVQKSALMYPWTW
ncbi:MAG: hypothetical protein HUJ22_03280 [Gracilimonas sp.]|uniref:hypothetical protein n=1 Tax=Gracilimonas sp. TaxID=1974203 RepID=UPI001990403D|nr:hypothetical protein [Gracilimonas sp.]MBD3615570.1 hypothetical protein [Gracilimonas sp.]